jgi:hypothetical protein
MALVNDGEVFYSDGAQGEASHFRLVHSSSRSRRISTFVRLATALLLGIGRNQAGVDRKGSPVDQPLSSPISVNRMCQENAGAEQSHKRGGQFKH